MRPIVVALVLALAGCAPAASTHEPAARPLAGRVWDVARARFVEPAALVAELARARFVLLGETHDDPEHHRGQAWIGEELLAAGRRPAVAFEMLRPEDAARIARQLAAAPRDADALAAAVDWAHSGWPAFALYRPIVRAALDAGVPVVPANVPAAALREVLRGGLAALEPALAERQALDRPLPPGEARAAAEEIRAVHCGRLPESMVPGMAAAQRARDAAMADAMIEAATGDGAVLIAGRGHVRTDRGVPFYLRTRRPEARVASVAFVEARPGPATPAAYAETFGAAALPFDWVWFTPPRPDGGDPCAGMPGPR
jgi:uncharacterized iron-regulated protein